MTYDLAVWEGKRLADADSGAIFVQMYRQYIDTDIESHRPPRVVQHMQRVR